MIYLTCTTITSVDLAHYGVSRAKDWVSVDYDTLYYGRYMTNKTNLTSLFELALRLFACFKIRRKMLAADLFLFIH